MSKCQNSKQYNIKNMIDFIDLFDLFIICKKHYLLLTYHNLSQITITIYLFALARISSILNSKSSWSTPSGSFSSPIL